MASSVDDRRKLGNITDLDLLHNVLDNEKHDILFIKSVSNHDA